jgi:hypothetical protein
MIQAKAVHSQADAHGQELRLAAGSQRATRRLAREAGQHMGEQSPASRSAAGLPVAGGPARRRAVAPRVGAWLIEFGTRLGGASIRTS